MLKMAVKMVKDMVNKTIATEHPCQILGQMLDLVPRHWSKSGWGCCWLLISTFLIIFWFRSYYSFLNRRQPGPIKSVLLVIIGWLVGNAVFSETTLRIFLIFCMKLGGYKDRKVSLIFEKNSWFGDIREKVSKLAQNQTLWYFFQKRL